MASDIWLRTILIVRKETCCRHIGYSFRLAARVLLYAPSHRQDSTYHGLCYTSRGALAGTRLSKMNEYLTTPQHKNDLAIESNVMLNHMANEIMLTGLCQYYCIILFSINLPQYDIVIFI